MRLAGLEGLPVVRRQLRWSRTVALDTHLANISSRSAFLVRDEALNHAFLEEERIRLTGLFPDGMVEETYVVDLFVARRP